MKKKGAEMAIQLIVVAGIVLFILVIVIILFGSKMKIFGTSLQKCSGKGGVCESKCETNEATIPDTDCASGQSCCVDIFDSAADNDS